MAGLQFSEKNLNESREGFCRRGRGRSFHVDGPKTEKAREPTVESLVRVCAEMAAVLCGTNHVIITSLSKKPRWQQFHVVPAMS